MKKRFGQMIKVKPEKLAEYKKWHANPMPGVNEMIKECGLKNYSIYSRGEYLFTYFSTKAKILMQIWQRWQQIRQHKDGGML